METPLEEGQATGAPRAWLGRLFLVLTLLQLIPIWSVRYVPTSDGGAHLYNSWVLRTLLTGEAGGLIKEYYQINWKPLPNWFGHAFMAAAMGVVSPIVAEKLLLSATILMFSAGLWFFAGANDERSRAWAFLGFPFAYNAFLQMGFYNFAFSVGLYLLIVGVWWSHRDRPDSATIGTIAALLVVCYFAHPMSTLLAIGSIGLLWFATLQGRTLQRHARHLLAFLPVMPLLYWFALESGLQMFPNQRPASWLWDFIVKAKIAATFSDRQMLAGIAVFALTIILFVATVIRENLVRTDRGRVWRFREADAFLLVLLSCVVLYVAAPAEAAGGLLVTERMTLFIHLLPLAWFSGRLPGFEKIVVATMTVVAIVYTVFFTNRYLHYDGMIRAYISPLDAMEPNSTVLPLMFEREVPGTFIGVLSHVLGYKAIDKELVYLGNYEPGTWLFPLAYRPDIQPPDVGMVEARPGDLPLSTYRPMAKYIYTWRMPAGIPIAARIAESYRLVAAKGEARLYRRLRDTLAAGEGEMILLPVAGTSGLLGAPGGARWKVDQQVTNTGTAPLPVSISSCVPDAPCETELEAGQTVNLASANDIIRFLIVRVPKGTAKQLQFRTVAHRVDRYQPDVHLEIPAVHERAFRKGRIEIRDVPFTEDSRVSLRLWIRGPVRARTFTLRLVDAGGRMIAQKTFPIGRDAFWATGALESAFPQLKEGFQASLIVEADPPAREAAVWALVTMVDNATGGQRLILPESGTGF